LQQRREGAETQIAKLEAEIAGYEAALADFRSAGETIRLSDRLARRRADLSALLKEWEEVSEQIEGQ
jgi:chromosome segregation ATPase